MILYHLSGACGALYVIARIAGEPLPILALACFTLVVIAITTDPEFAEQNDGPA
jgi:hypothetical protein